MNNKYIRTEEEYMALFRGDVKYYVVSHIKKGHGLKPCCLKIFLWNLVHRNKKISYDYPHYSDHYCIIVAARDKVCLEWSSQDMSTFIEKNNLQNKDTLTVYFLSQGGRNGHYCIGGRVYLITENGWKVIDKIRGM